MCVTCILLILWSGHILCVPTSHSMRTLSGQERKDWLAENGLVLRGRTVAEQKSCLEQLCFSEKVRPNLSRLIYTHKSSPGHIYIYEYISVNKYIKFLDMHSMALCVQ